MLFFPEGGVVWNLPYCMRLRTNWLFYEFMAFGYESTVLVHESNVLVYKSMAQF